MRTYSAADVAAYMSFVEQGGSLLIAADGRPLTPTASPDRQRLDEAFSVAFGESIDGQVGVRSTAVSRGQGKVLFIGSAQPLTAAMQPLTDRVIDWLTTRDWAAGPEPILPVEVTRKPAALPSSGLRPPSPEDLEAYRAASDRAGHDADAQLRLALWCEAHDLAAEQIKHLNLAVEANPDHATARRLLRQIAAGDGWQTLDAVEDQTKGNAALAKALAEYNARREVTPEKAEDQWKLALWCEKNGLEAEARAHLTVVTRLAPGRAEAWLRLGCKRYNGRWLTEGQIAAEKAEVEAQKQADRIWQLRLERMARRYFGPESERAARLEEMSAVTDPRAVPAIWRVFARNKTNVKSPGGGGSPARTNRFAPRHPADRGPGCLREDGGRADQGCRDPSQARPA